MGKWGFAELGGNVVKSQYISSLNKKIKNV